MQFIFYTYFNSSIER